MFSKRGWWTKKQQQKMDFQKGRQKEEKKAE